MYVVNKNIVVIKKKINFKLNDKLNNSLEAILDT